MFSSLRGYHSSIMSSGVCTISILCTPEEGHRPKRCVFCYAIAITSLANTVQSSLIIRLKASNPNAKDKTHTHNYYHTLWFTIIIKAVLMKQLGMWLKLVYVIISCTACIRDVLFSSSMLLLNTSSMLHDWAPWGIVSTKIIIKKWILLIHSNMQIFDTCW